MSFRAAAYVYNVRKSTLHNIYNKKEIRPPGRATELSSTEEDALVAHLLCQADWGFPMTRLDLQFLVKGYLDSKGAQAPRFKENMPGKKWMRKFLQRHPQLNLRVPKLIKAARARVDPGTVKTYFDNLSETLKGVPPENILNFDETNVTDDPVNKHALIRRGEKYPVSVMTTSKSAISIMFAGTASGTLLPPYVVYKAKDLCESWTAGGPPGARYNRSKSGWFDMNIFEDWFSTVLLPWARSLDGPKVVIGDNVSSHFSPKVFQMCAENQIKFVCLPPNSTHLLQPLDVAFFSPLKCSWRKILHAWKQKSRNKTLTLPKPNFPGLLKELMQSIEANCERNLVVAFKATGVHPLDRNQALKRIPGGVKSPSRHEVYSQVSEAFLGRLQVERYGEAGAPRRGRRLHVSPGKSWAAPTVQTGSGRLEEEVDDPEATVVSEHEGDETTPRRPKRQRLARAHNQPQGRRRGAAPRNSVHSVPKVAAPSTVQPIAPQIEPVAGNYVLLKLPGNKHAVGLVSSVDDNLELVIKCLKPQEKQLFVWPPQQVLQTVDYSEIVEILSEPKKLKRKGCPLRFDFEFKNLVLV